MEDSVEGRATLASMAFEASATYEQVRPSYDAESVKFFLRKLGILEQERTKPLSILELGAGTGKFTRVLMDVLKGIDARVIASDPTNTMVQEFRRVLPNVELLQCFAENIGRCSFILYGEAPPRGPTPYPFIYHFFRKGTPFVYLLLEKGTPFIYLLKKTYE